jgi:hypothetical protein
MSDEELYQSVRGIWRLNAVRAERYRFAVAVHPGVTRGVWEIDHGTWRQHPDHNGVLRWAFRGTSIDRGPEFEAFVGARGRAIPERRPDGRSTFGSQAVIAYWPAYMRRRIHGKDSVECRNHNKSVIRRFH